jgi:hypothetical protein
MELQTIQSKIYELRGRRVMLDRNTEPVGTKTDNQLKSGALYRVSDYGVQTMRINEAVKNNPDKFPSGYIFEITDEESKSLRSKFPTLNKSGGGQQTKPIRR